MQKPSMHMTDQLWDAQDCETIERARNVALDRLERSGVRFHGDLAALTLPLDENWAVLRLYRAGIDFAGRPHCRLHLDYRGHANGAFVVEVAGRPRARLTFRADANLAQRLAD